MESTATTRPVEVAGGTARPGLALALSLLSVPGSTAAWDLFDGAGFVIGVPLAVAAIVIALQARKRSHASRGMTTAAIVIAGAMLAMTAIWTLAGVA
jgi:hypothetical protein